MAPSACKGASGPSWNEIVRRSDRFHVGNRDWFNAKLYQSKNPRSETSSIYLRYEQWAMDTQLCREGRHRRLTNISPGTQPFLDLEILVRPPTLIPRLVINTTTLCFQKHILLTVHFLGYFFRWETEEWTGRLAKLVKTFMISNGSVVGHEDRSESQNPTGPAPFNILDLCTGSGCIPLGLASALPKSSCKLIGVDIHDLAIQLAQDNEVINRRLLNNNPVQFQKADLFHPNAVHMFLNRQDSFPILDQAANTEAKGLPSKGLPFNLVVSNPPYIAHSEQPELEPEVSKWEDPKALMADEEGLIFYPKIAQMAIELLDTKSRRNGPVLDRVVMPEVVLEIGGDHQADAVTTSVRHAGFTRVEVWKDLAGRARCVVGSR